MHEDMRGEFSQKNLSYEIPNNSWFDFLFLSLIGARFLFDDGNKRES